MNNITNLDWAYEQFAKSYTEKHHHGLPALESLDLSCRTYYCLMTDGITTLPRLLACTYDDIIKMRNLNEKCADEIVEKLEKFELSLACI